MRAKPAGRRKRHSGSQTKPPGFIRGSGHDTTLVSFSSNNDRLSSELRPENLLHRNEESIEVYMHDLVRGHCYSSRIESGINQQFNARNFWFGSCQNLFTMQLPL